MKKNIVVCLTLALVMLMVLPAYAYGRVELGKVEYMGFGIIEVEFDDDCNWQSEAQFSLKDALGFDVPFQLLGRGDEEAYLLLTGTEIAPRLADGSACTLTITTADGTQSMDFELTTGQDYELTRNGSVRVDFSNDRCDFCGEYGHDDDFCPENFDLDRFIERQTIQK